jgi:ribosomal RNA-processing protein 8
MSKSSHRKKEKTIQPKTIAVKRKDGQKESKVTLRKVKLSNKDKVSLKTRLAQTIAKKKGVEAQKPQSNSSLPPSLKGAQFRFINERLYTSPSQDAVDFMKKDPSAFDAYHEGFRQQVEKWPVNPVDVYIAQIKKQLKTQKPLIIADLGCGDGKIATTFAQSGQLGKDVIVHSFDLVSPNKHVIACDVSKLPLKDATCDIAIFSLALMGTNWASFIMESSRVLKKGGHLKIAEVVSRFDSLDAFVEALTAMGLKLLSKDTNNKMFIFLEFEKTARKRDASLADSVKLDPCIYKKR